jgi:hypothetical protein
MIASPAKQVNATATFRKLVRLVAPGKGAVDASRCTYCQAGPLLLATHRSRLPGDDSGQPLGIVTHTSRCDGRK